MGRKRVFEIRFASTGVICGNPYPVCKKKFNGMDSVQSLVLVMVSGKQACFFFYKDLWKKS